MFIENNFTQEAASILPRTVARNTINSCLLLQSATFELMPVTYYLSEFWPPREKCISPADPRSLSVASKLPTVVPGEEFSVRAKLKEELLKKTGELSLTSYKQKQT